MCKGGGVWGVVGEEGASDRLKITTFGIAFYQSNLSTPNSELNEIMIKDDIEDILYRYNCIRTGIPTGIRFNRKKF